MAAVIASRTASARFTEDPEDFGREFSLVESELTMLGEMGDDLTSLTAAFVSKRRSTLRWNARRTLELLGDEGEEILDDFVEEHPQTESFRNDAATFCDFVVVRTAARPRRRAMDHVVAEMARFEHHRSNSFWDATSLAGRDDERHVRRTSAPPGPATPDEHRAVVLAPGANVGHFDLDVRLAFRRTVRPWYLLPPDPCNLLFFHCRHRAQLRTLRLRDTDAAVVRAMPSGRPVTISSLRASEPEEADVDHLLRTLSWEEAIEWE